MLDEKLNIICKSCGGTFEGLENTTYGKCPYCGSEIFVNYISKKIIWKKRTMFYQFKKMDDINSEKYIRYRYKEEVSNKMLEYVILEIVILAFIMIFFEMENGMKWLMIGVLAVLCLASQFVLIPRMYLSNEELRTASGYCEYTFAVLQCKSRMSFICSDGRKLVCKVKLKGWEEICEGEEVVLVHIPSIQKVFVEKTKRMKKKFGIYK